MRPQRPCSHATDDGEYISKQQLPRAYLNNLRSDYFGGFLAKVEQRRPRNRDNSHLDGCATQADLSGKIAPSQQPRLARAHLLADSAKPQPSSHTRLPLLLGREGITFIARCRMSSTSLADSFVTLFFTNSGKITQIGAERKLPVGNIGRPALTSYFSLRFGTPRCGPG